MPPLVPFLPLIGDALGAATLGLGISNSLSKPNTPTAAPVNTIPGSPLTTVNSGAGGGSGGLPPNGVLGQIIGAKPASSPMSGGMTPSVGGVGGAGRSAAPPASIGGGGDIGTLPWITGAASPTLEPAPGTPGAA
jgi:hypothetical protein